MGAYEAAEIAVRGTQIIPATPEGDSVSETAPDLCAARCPHGHDHTCARSPQHCGFHRDVKQKGDESCSWTDGDRPAVGPVYESPEELAAEIVRLREESARAYSQGVEDMREKAVQIAEAYSAPSYISTGIRDVTLTGTPKDTPAPSLEDRVADLEADNAFRKESWNNVVLSLRRTSSKARLAYSRGEGNSELIGEASHTLADHHKRLVELEELVASLAEAVEAHSRALDGK